jgi:hypothetical protein
MLKKQDLVVFNALQYIFELLFSVFTILFLSALFLRVLFIVIHCLKIDLTQNK